MARFMLNDLARKVLKIVNVLQQLIAAVSVGGSRLCSCYSGGIMR